MMKYLLFFAVISSTFNLIGQTTMQDVESMKPSEEYENISVQKIHGDSLTSSFVIWIKDTVKTHKHTKHSEHVYVLEGSGDFYLNDEMITIKKGDLIFIPANNWHSVKVTSDVPMKVLSVQSPGFYGEDRIFKDQN